jgi:hypothetical protein
MEQAIWNAVPAESRLLQSVKMLPSFSNQQDAFVFSIGE